LEVVSATKVPLALVLHLRSPSGLFVRAATDPEVLVALQVADAARTDSVHDEFALTVSNGPLVVLKPAVKSAAVGAGKAVVVELIVSLTT
jgi:hypothetical protein